MILGDEKENKIYVPPDKSTFLLDDRNCRSHDE